MSARFVIELELDDEGGWSATMPDTPTLPREYQGLAAVARTTPSDALRGLADALVEAAEHRLGQDLDVAASRTEAEVANLFGDAAARDMLEGR